MRRSHGMEEMHRILFVEIANELVNVERCISCLMQYYIGVYFNLHAL